MPTSAKELLKKRNAQKLNRLKKNSIKGKIQKRKNKQESDDSLQAQSSNPDSYKDYKGQKSASASKGPGPLLRFCGGKSKPYSKKKK